MSEARIDSLSNESNTGGPTLSGITTFSGTNYFVPPVGDTAQRPQNPQKGALRFNTDTAHLEYFRGNTLGWTEIEASHGQLGGGTGSNTGTGARGVFGNRAEPSITDEIDYITISTLGNAQLFGESITNRYCYGSCSSSTRGFMAGGFSPVDDTIEYVIFSSTGDATDFGNLTDGRRGTAGASNGHGGL